MTYDPNDPNRPFEYPSSEQSGRPVDPSAPIDYPATNPSGYPQPPGYPPATGYPGPAFPPPYQPYGTSPYDPYRLDPIRQTNGQAIGALIAGIVGVPLCFCGIPSIIAIVLGILAMNETKRTGQDGHGMALAGVIIGVIGLALAVLTWIASAAGHTDSSY
jgi:Domain of unknown function (DUF4190)